MFIVQCADVPDSFWGTQVEYEEGERYLAGFVAALELEPVLKLDDDFGWDYMYLLPDGRYVMADRNSGTAAYYTKEEFDYLSLCKGEEHE